MIKRNFPCRRSTLQEYKCCVCTYPKWKSSHKWICFDKCLANELFYLWDMGIITTGCCCGFHKGQNGENSYIGVEEKFIHKMKELGYKIRLNKCENQEKREDSFIPKTFYSEENYKKLKNFE